MWETAVEAYLSTHDLVTVALIGLAGVSGTNLMAWLRIKEDRRQKAQEWAVQEAEAARLRETEGLAAQAMQDAIQQHTINEAILESMNVAFVLTDGETNVVRWNDAACALLGWSEHEMRGRPVSVIIPLSLRAAHLAGLDRYRRTGQGNALGRTLAMSALHKDGRTIPVYLSLFTFEVLPAETRFFSAVLVPRELLEKGTTEKGTNDSRQNFGQKGKHT